jgi:hypothetical protein
MTANQKAFRGGELRLLAGSRRWRRYFWNRSVPDFGCQSVIAEPKSGILGPVRTRLSCLGKCETGLGTKRMPKMNYGFVLALALVACLPVRANAQTESGSTAKAVASSKAETKYLVAHLEADQRFITSIERSGPCTLPGPPLVVENPKVPYQLYPTESVKQHEEGTVVMQLIFDSDWCVRKATIVKSTKFWRLDYVSLQRAMNIKWTPKNAVLTPDGEPTVTIPIGWGASQGVDRRAIPTR